MAMRRRESRAKRYKSFGKHARKTHKKNFHAGPMRGGIRL